VRTIGGAFVTNPIEGIADGSHRLSLTAQASLAPVHQSKSGAKQPSAFRLLPISIYKCRFLSMSLLRFLLSHLLSKHIHFLCQDRCSSPRNAVPSCSSLSPHTSIYSIRAIATPGINLRALSHRSCNSHSGLREGHQNLQVYYIVF
jgi:hypothetical protein